MGSGARYGQALAALALMAVAGCAGGSRMTLLSEVDLGAQGQADLVAQPQEAELPGLFQALFRGPPQSPPGPAAAAAAPGLMGRLLGGGAPPVSGVDAREIGATDTLPFGEIARVCDIDRDQMGREIDRHGGVTVWDSFPNSTAPRPHFITGFGDGCARSLTAALVMIGDPLTHETERYSSRAPYDAADDAYERLKTRICHSARGVPCGAAMPRLQRQVTMLTTYERFGDPEAAALVILHRDSVVFAGRRGR